MSVSFSPLGMGVLICFCLSACEPDGASGAAPSEPIDTFFKSIPEESQYPEDNTHSNEKENLGELLFWDPVLSGSENVACATCHHPAHGWADGRELSIGSDGVGLGADRVGFNTTPKHSPSIINVAFTGLANEDIPDNFVSGAYFWDLRAATLEEQAIEPIKSDIEMRGFDFSEDEIMPEIVRRLLSIEEYVAYFEAAFPLDEPAITEMNIAKALATFQRKIITRRTRFDDYVDGDETALSDREITGLNKFINGGCARCHSGSMLSDFTIHADEPIIREKEAVRTAPLRNVELTAPYMHDGSRGSLNSAISIYEDRGDLDVTLSDDDFGDIAEFLRTLTDNEVFSDIPTAVPSGLSVGGDIDL